MTLSEYVTLKLVVIQNKIEANLFRKFAMDDYFSEPGDPTLDVFFSELEDPRIERTKKYSLNEILLLAICGNLCGSDSWHGIVLVGEYKLDWLRKFFPYLESRELSCVSPDVTRGQARQGPAEVVLFREDNC